MSLGLRLFLGLLFFCSLNTSYATCTGIGCSCSVSASTLAFLQYVPTDSTDKDVNGNVAVTCEAALGTYIVSYVIALNAGNGGSFSPRVMNSSGHLLNYNLYTTTGRTTVWGDGTGGTGTISDSYTSILSQETRNYTVFGRIFALQNAFIGSYSDTITVTVTY